MKNLFTLAICLWATLSLFSQSNINSMNSSGFDPHSSAQLGVQATDEAMLASRINDTQRIR